MKKTKNTSAGKKANQSKTDQAPSGRTGEPTASKVQVTPGEVRIKYSDSHDLLEKLFGLSQSVSRLHTHALLANKPAKQINALDYMSEASIPDVLGPQRAFEIVTNCAGETDLTKKLGEIPGLDPVIFQTCVQSGVIGAGYKPGSIPASSNTTLWEVVQAIQGCTK
jgi:hypothetical protein